MTINYENTTNGRTPRSRGRAICPLNKHVPQSHRHHRNQKKHHRRRTKRNFQCYSHTIAARKSIIVTEASKIDYNDKSHIIISHHRSQESIIATEASEIFTDDKLTSTQPGKMMKATFPTSTPKENITKITPSQLRSMKV